MLVQRRAHVALFVRILVLVMVAMVATVSLAERRPGGRPEAVPEIAPVVADYPCEHRRSPGRRCHPFVSPSRIMVREFKGGYLGTARGIRLPSWVFRRAKEYVLAHPSVAPCSANPACYGPLLRQRGLAPRGISWPWHWGWLQWTARTLNDGRCVSVPTPATLPLWFFGCHSTPDWVQETRRVEVICGGAGIIIGFATRNPIAVGSGVSTCAWSQTSSKFWR
ncbi:hypothetical protein GCM10028772_22910 [Nocardioides ultimimeridianus]